MSGEQYRLTLSPVLLALSTQFYKAGCMRQMNSHDTSRRLWDPAQSRAQTPGHFQSGLNTVQLAILEHEAWNLTSHGPISCVTIASWPVVVCFDKMKLHL